MPPAATARLVALPDTLRAWAREDAVVRLHLGAHVTAGVPLGLALARLCEALGEDGAHQLHQRLVAGEPSAGSGHWWPWCAHELPGGLRCRALSRVLVGGVAGCTCVEACDDCAAAMARAGTGRVLRALAPR